MHSSSTFMTEFAGRMKSFCHSLLTEMQLQNFLVDVTEIDHACYRVGTVERYEEVRGQLLQQGTLLSEALINGRPIATFQLKEPVIVTDKQGTSWPVGLVELPAPKPGRVYDEGFEHIEAVTSIDLKEFVDRHKTHAFDCAHLAAPINGDVSLHFPAGLVKFHEASLAAVISKEKRVLASRKVRPLVMMDFDDTLLNSKEPFLSAMAAALSSHLGKDVALDIVRDKAKPTFPEFFAGFGVTTTASSAALLALFQEAWQGVAAQCKVPTGIISMLSCLLSEGIDIVVWTARDKATTEASLTQFGMSPFISGIDGYLPTCASKPNPSEELRRLCAGRPVAVIGDSYSDAQGARELGCPFIQATWVHHKHIRPSAEHPCAVAQSPHSAAALALKHLSPLNKV